MTILNGPLIYKKNKKVQVQTQYKNELLDTGLHFALFYRQEFLPVHLAYLHHGHVRVTQLFGAIMQRLVHHLEMVNIII